MWCLSPRAPQETEEEEKRAEIRVQIPTTSKRRPPRGGGDSRWDVHSQVTLPHWSLHTDLEGSGRYVLVSTPVVFFQFFQRQAFLSFAANRLKMPQKTRKRERRREKEKEKISIFNLFPKSFSRGFKVNGSHCAPAHPKTYKRQTHLAHTLREGSNSSLVYLDATLLLVIPRHLACLCWRPLVSFLGQSESTSEARFSVSSKNH